MVDARPLLDDLKRLVKRLEDDLRERSGAVPGMADHLRAEYRAAREAGRTGESFEIWREGVLTQAAVAWILGGVFVRFLEDNRLVDEPLISGPGERRGRAADRQTLYFQAHPTDTDRDYLYDAFRAVAELPAMTGLYDGAHNPVWSYGISGDAAKALIGFWRRVVPETGELAHDFTDPNWDTRFLGDLYQGLSEAARKRFALLQTPEFVEAFILDRTLEPAIAGFGLDAVRLIDPTCGSGHFLLGAFRRLLDRWFRHAPGVPERALVQRALDGVSGVDINPYAAAIARFRLLVEALKASRIRRLKEAPGYRIHVTAGDSLLHGPRFGFGELDLGGEAEHLAGRAGIGHAFEAEDLDALNRILGQRYHAVVGNPPYITVKDKALNPLYRARYTSCHRQYSLAVPFAERFFQLAMPAAADEEGAGFVGMITANSFMKREFGRKLIEEFFPKVDLSYLIDTSGAYIPGHGTPTAILFGRARKPVMNTVRTVMGIKGEPATPDDPAKGRVWSAIVGQVDQEGSESEWVSVADTPRETFGKHPWSISGGGAVELIQVVETHAFKILHDFVGAIGRTTVVGEDDVWIMDSSAANRLKLKKYTSPLAIGEKIRDWSEDDLPIVIYPYNELAGSPVPQTEYLVSRYLWIYRTLLSARTVFGKSFTDREEPWYIHLEHYRDKLRTPLSIAFAFVATHNHFVLDRGGKVFNRSAPVIKLPAGATEADHLALLGLLNSSTACFWMKQVFHNKGSTVDTKGARQTTDAFENFYEFTGTGLKKFPVPGTKPLALATELDRLARERQGHLPAQLVSTLPLSRADLDTHRDAAGSLLRRMIALQEELDWRCYGLYGVTDQDLRHPDPPEITLGQRAFEIVLAREMAKGRLETTWFERHGSEPVTGIPGDWPQDYREIVARRIALIETDRSIGLIEKPEYKRRWNQESWDALEKRALRGWLLDRLEEPRYRPQAQLQSARTLAERAQTDAEFMQVAEVYVGHPGFDAAGLVAGLVEGESVPFLPALRYKPSGRRKREVWDETWALQRREDAVDARVALALTRVEGETDEAYSKRLESEQRRRRQAELGDIAPPPKYRSADFLNATVWRLRGALDVPRERFVSYPHCSRENDPSLLVGWAGWDPLQQARALASYYTEVVEGEGWSPERLTPLLAGLAELLPWLGQWHNDIDPDYNERMGDFFETYLGSELHRQGLTMEDLKTWAPPRTVRRGRRKA